MNFKFVGTPLLFCISLLHSPHTGKSQPMNIACSWVGLCCSCLGLGKYCDLDTYMAVAVNCGVSFASVLSTRTLLFLGPYWPPNVGKLLHYSVKHIVVIVMSARFANVGVWLRIGASGPCPESCGGSLCIGRRRQISKHCLQYGTAGLEQYITALM